MQTRPKLASVFALPELRDTGIAHVFISAAHHARGCVAALYVVRGGHVR